MPIKGVPDELIQILNARFREASGGAASTSVGGSAAGFFFTHKGRPDANAQGIGTFGTETDRGVVYQVQTVRSAQVWVYVSGVMRATFANRPTDLGAQDEGFQWSVTDYGHLLRWTGTGWEFEDDHGGYIAGRAVAPDGNGWQLCDGSSTNYLHVTGGAVSEVSYTTPNLNGTPAYLKWANAYTGTIVAANAPTTGPFNAAAGGTAVVQSVNNNGEPAHLNLLPYFRR
jgi:hypothetical protein